MTRTTAQRWRLLLRVFEVAHIPRPDRLVVVPDLQVAVAACRGSFQPAHHPCNVGRGLHEDQQLARVLILRKIGARRNAQVAHAVLDARGDDGEILGKERFKGIVLRSLRERLKQRVHARLPFIKSERLLLCAQRARLAALKGAALCQPLRKARRKLSSKPSARLKTECGVAAQSGRSHARCLPSCPGLRLQRPTSSAPRQCRRCGRPARRQLARRPRPRGCRS